MIMYFLFLSCKFVCLKFNSNYTDNWKCSKIQHLNFTSLQATTHSKTCSAQVGSASCLWVMSLHQLVGAHALPIGGGPCFRQLVGAYQWRSQYEIWGGNCILLNFLIDNDFTSCVACKLEQQNDPNFNPLPQACFPSPKCIETLLQQCRIQTIFSRQ